MTRLVLLQVTAHVTFREALLLCIPTGFDLAATTLMNVGLLYVAASGGVPAYLL